MASPIFNSNLPTDIELILKSNLNPETQRKKIRELLEHDPRWSVLSSSDLRLKNIFKEQAINYIESMVRVYSRDRDLFKRRIQEAPPKEKIAIASLIFAEYPTENVLTDCDMPPNLKTLVFENLAHRAVSGQLDLSKYASRDRLPIILAVREWRTDAIRRLLKNYPLNPEEWLTFARLRTEIYVSAVLEDGAPLINEKVFCQRISSSSRLLSDWINNRKFNLLIRDKKNRQDLYQKMIKEDFSYLLTHPFVKCTKDEKLEIALAYANFPGDSILQLSEEEQELAFDFLLDRKILDVLLSNIPIQDQKKIRESVEKLRVKLGGLEPLINAIETLSAESISTLNTFEKPPKHQQTPPDGQSWLCVGSTNGYRFFEPKIPYDPPLPFPAVEMDLRTCQKATFSGTELGWSLLCPLFSNNPKILNIFDQSILKNLFRALGFCLGKDNILMLPTIDEVNRRLEILLSSLGVPFEPIQVVKVNDTDEEVDGTLIRAASDMRLLLSTGKFFLHDMEFHVFPFAVFKIIDATGGSAWLMNAKRLLTPLKEIEEWICEMEAMAKEGEMNPADREFVRDYVPLWRGLLAALVDETLTLVGITNLVETQENFVHMMKKMMTRLDPKWVKYFNERFSPLFEKNPKVLTREAFDSYTERLLTIHKPRSNFF